ncbi:MAG: TetR/AcrR family transcriptional regulator [Chloroflexales bacterium]|nr:TetR/AcrR family transcriptional regulator [Chloroflexales bacterium]
MTKGAQTRQRIVERAASLFNTQGFAGTSLGDLIAATGLEKGGLYNHFASKEALALAAFDHAVAILAARYTQALEAHSSARDKLVALVTTFAAHYDAPPLPGGCPIFNTMVEADDTHPALRERAEAAMTAWLKLIGATVRQGMRSGELRPDLDPRAVATLVTATLEGALALSRLYHEPAHLQRAVTHLVWYLRTLELPAGTR